MREEEFARWLAEIYLAPTGARLDSDTQSSTIYSCRTVEKHEGDLDRHYEKDGLKELEGRLKYSAREQVAGTPPRHSILVGANAYMMSASYRAAIKLYHEFCIAWAQGAYATPAPTTPDREAARPGRMDEGSLAWPYWGQPGERDLLPQARLTAKFARFLHPAIVAAVVEDNAAKELMWRDALAARGIDAGRWLWPRGPCAFPGIRRYAGSREMRATREGGGRDDEVPSDALLVDDNTYPRHLWSFALRGRPFQAPGPRGYALAHLVDHKARADRLPQELRVPVGLDLELGLPGLYTSPTNTVYVPQGLVRPADFAGALRNLLQRRALHLYEGYCEPLPPGLALRDHGAGDWAVESFEWANPVGDLKWADAFLQFRGKLMENLLGGAVGKPVAAKPVAGKPVAAMRAAGETPTASRQPFEVRGPEGTTHRLQIGCDEALSAEKKGWHEEMRSAVRQGLEQLPTDRGSILRAAYVSAEELEGADLEDLLLHHVGRSDIFRRLTREGLALERLKQRPPQAPGETVRRHRHVYELVGTGSVLRHCQREAELASWANVSLDPHGLSAGGVWLAMHGGSVNAHEEVAVPPDAFGLDVSLSVAVDSELAASDLVKPLVDGVVSALHSYGGTEAEEVTSGLAMGLPVTGERIGALLARRAGAPLGLYRFVRTRGEGVEWCPADHACVAVVVRIQRMVELQAGVITMTGRAFRVTPKA